jgi:hypothetical protein
VVALPIRRMSSPSIPPQSSDDVAIGIEHANFRYGLERELLLSSCFPKQRSGLEYRRGGGVLVVENWWDSHTAQPEKLEDDRHVSRGS